MHIGHCLSDHKHTGTNQGEGEKGSDTGHFTGQACRNESCQQTDEHHEQQIAAGRCSELLIDVRKERGQQSVMTHAEEHAALS